MNPYTYIQHACAHTACLCIIPRLSCAAMRQDPWKTSNRPRRGKAPTRQTPSKHEYVRMYCCIIREERCIYSCGPARFLLACFGKKWWHGDHLNHLPSARNFIHCAIPSSKMYQVESQTLGADGGGDTTYYYNRKIQSA